MYFSLCVLVCTSWSMQTTYRLRTSSSYRTSAVVPSGIQYSLRVPGPPGPPASYKPPTFPPTTTPTRPPTSKTQTPPPFGTPLPPPGPIGKLILSIHDCICNDSQKGIRTFHPEIYTSI